MHALSARRAGARARCCRRARRPRPCARWSPSGAARTAAIGTLLAAQHLRRHGHPRGRRGSRRQRNALRLAGARRRASRRAAAAARSAAERRRVEDLARVLGAGAEQPGLAGALPGRVRAARDQPDEDRVAPAPRAARALHVLRRPRRARARRSGRARRSTALRALCEHVGVLGSYRAAGSAVRLTRALAASALAPRGREAPLDCRADDGEHCPTRAGGVRVAFRAPAART